MKYFNENSILRLFFLDSCWNFDSKGNTLKLKLSKIFNWFHQNTNLKINDILFDVIFGIISNVR